jgi:hypothetical protein
MPGRQLSSSPVGVHTCASGCMMQEGVWSDAWSIRGFRWERTGSRGTGGIFQAIADDVRMERKAVMIKLST